jgi:adenylate cyclase
VAGAALAEGGANDRFVMTPLFSPGLSILPGFSNAPVGDDGVIRRMAAVLPGTDGGYLPSLALAATASAAGYTPERLAGALRAGGRLDLPVVDGAGLLAGEQSIDVDVLAHRVWRVDFTGGPGSVITFPAGPIFEMARTGVRATADNPFNGKIVLVGATFADSRDFYPTPLGLMAGVEIQANMVHTVLARRALLPPSLALNLGLLAAMCLVSALLSLWLRPLWAGLASGAVILLVVVASYEAYTRGGYWLDFVAPVVGMLAYLQWSAHLARRRLRSAFGQYVSPEVLERVTREGADLAGEIRTVSILMSDVRGFTTLSETLPPAQIAEVMNEYFEAMVDVVLANGGMVNDFIGDGLLALFGAPARDAEHAWHAVLTALGMLEALERLNARWQAAGGATLAIGVAVNTGTVFAGNMGSPLRKKYTVMGDPVNTTARMEGLNAQLGTTILLSSATLAAVKDRVIVEDRGSVMMKGKAEAVEIFELMRRA